MTYRQRSYIPSLLILRFLEGAGIWGRFPSPGVARGATGCSARTIDGRTFRRPPTAAAAQWPESDGEALEAVPSLLGTWDPSYLKAEVSQSHGHSVSSSARTQKGIERPLDIPIARGQYSSNNTRLDRRERLLQGVLRLFSWVQGAWRLWRGCLRGGRLSGGGEELTTPLSCGSSSKSIGRAVVGDSARRLVGEFRAAKGLLGVVCMNVSLMRQQLAVFIRRVHIPFYLPPTLWDIWRSRQNGDSFLKTKSEEQCCLRRMSRNVLKAPSDVGCT